MLSLYQKFHTSLNMLLLLLLGLTCGILASSLIETFVKPLPVASGEVALGKRPQQEAINETDLTLILRNNLFDSLSRSQSASLSLHDQHSTTGPASQGQATQTAARADNLKLYGTVVSGADSLALIEFDKAMELYRIGDLLPGGGILDGIDRHQVRIGLGGDNVAVLLLENEEQQSAATKKSTPQQDDTSGIRQLDDQHWVIPQAAAEQTRANLATEMRLAQLQPRITAGKTDGFMIRRLRRDSILTKLGLQRGDVVLQVNNMPLDSPETALRVFQQLREARQISVGIERKGSPMIFSYELD